MVSKLVLSLVLLAATGGSASDSFPKAGSYAFNWLDPENAACRMLDDADIADMKSCAASANAFGIDLPSQACRVNEEVEFIVYDTKAHCQEALETMQANAP